ncbi:MAG: ATP-binding cassette domain-containing protein [Nitrospirae bacterium]|nr:ATP-binding cassette domain-containing protein [Nitrospirota bacterium]
MALISLNEISVTFGGPLLFDQLTLHLEAGERVALLGRNGTGKTTLMKVIAGQMKVDSGKIIRQQGVEITHLPQEIPVDINGNVFDIVASGLGNRGGLIKDYHHIIHQMHDDHSPELMRRLERLQTELDHTGGWDINNQVEYVIAQMKLDPESDFQNLSGGQKRRTLLAKALVLKPGILLLDEPTNHLDIDSINWLEGFLKNYPGTLLLVTHDRMFMRNISTRIIELDRGKLFSWSCDYETFLIRKQNALDNEAAKQAEFDKVLAEGEIWIRKGVKARRTRNEGMVKVLERMREEKKAQRKAIGQVNMRAQEAALSGDLVIKVSHLNYSYGDNCIIKDFSTQIMRGDKIGVMGPNGMGKTTLLRLLLGEMVPMKGKVRLGTNLEIAYYDQLREQLDEELTVIENVCGKGDTVTINGKPRHIVGYLQDFLFSPERSRTPVKVLSGGERNRLFLARLFTRPSNVLVMDEPTNDLDIETLELLEELLIEYSGTLLLVSHDRAFLNNVVTSTMVLEGDGIINEYPGGYDDWLSQRRPEVKDSQPKAKDPGESNIVRKEKLRPLKLSFKEEKELGSLPEKIESLENAREELFSLMSDAEYFKKTPAEMSEIKTKLDTVEADLVSAYERWEYLEELRKRVGS